MNLTKKDIKEIKKNRINNMWFNSGNFGNFYQISKDKGIKIITNQDVHFRFHFTLEEFIPLTTIKVDGVSLPIEIGYDENGRFKGYSLPYFEGDKLPKVLRKNTKIEWNVIDHYFDTLYDKIIELTKNNIMISDIQPHNIIVNDNELKIIDCDFFKYKGNMSQREILIGNMFELKLGIERLKGKRLKEHLDGYFKEKRGKK